MMSFSPVLSGAVVVMTVCVANASHALVNGRFESGNFNGWTMDPQQDLATGQPDRQTGMIAKVVSAWKPSVDSTPVWRAEAGRLLVVLGSGADGCFTVNPTLKQTLALGKGAALSGWASFCTDGGDDGSSDCAWVKIYDSDGREVANPWQARSGDGRGGAGRDDGFVQCPSAHPWIQWEWEAPADGLYTVSLGTSSSRGDNHASYGFFNDICRQASHPAVPEPSSPALGVTGALLLAGWRRRHP